ncbi:MAG TPA: hypothetical protein VF981_10990, partial [Gemmatimonadaceae bacterium]
MFAELLRCARPAWDRSHEADGVRAEVARFARNQPIVKEIRPAEGGDPERWSGQLDAALGPSTPLGYC